MLRFLAEDVGEELDLVLDSMLRAIGHRAPAPTDLLTIIKLVTVVESLPPSPAESMAKAELARKIRREV